MPELSVDHFLDIIVAIDKVRRERGLHEQKDDILRQVLGYYEAARALEQRELQAA